MAIKSIIDTFIETVDPNKATVVSFPEFITIFGSKISLKKRPTKPKSKRDAFYWWVLDHHAGLKDLLIFPESYNDWSDFATYTDLLLFERDLGHLTGAVLIFLESAGSIAELGAFSQIDSLSERLIVVVTQNNHPARSFISLGPIRSIEETKKHPHSICVIPDVKPHALTAHIPVIFETLEKKRKRDDAVQTFNKSNPQHEILLLLDLINLFLVIQKTELQQLAQHFGIEMKLARLAQILFLLEKTQLIYCQHYGNNQYYVPRNFKKIYLDYTSNSSSPPFKRDKTKTLIWTEIQKDSYRKNVYEAIKEEASK